MTKVSGGIHNGIEWIYSRGIKYTCEFFSDGELIWYIESTGDMSVDFIEDFIDLKLEDVVNND